MRERIDDDRAATPIAGRSIGWLLVALFVAAYALSFVDRQILSLLVGDIRREFQVGDAQIGLLIGPVFGLCYAILGLPFGWLADKVHRMRLIAAGLLLWTGATIASGLAPTFALLVVARMGVGVGEAALVPAAVSLIADAFPPGRRALPLAVFTAGISVGAGLALLLGGSLIGFAQTHAADLPMIGAWLARRAPWRIVLILAGLAGIPLALMIGALPDLRRDRVAAGEDARNPADGLVRYLSRHRALFARMLSGAALLYVFSNALAAWMPSLFVRGFGWSPAEVGLRIGGVVLGCALAGTLLSGTLAGTMRRHGDASFRVMTLGALLLVPASLVAPLAPTAGVAQLGIASAYFALALCFGVATASFVAVTPAALRGRMIALYLLIGNLCGLGLGPPAIGLLLDRVLGDPARVGTALALLALPTTAIGALLLRSALALHGRVAAASASGPGIKNYGV